MFWVQSIKLFISDIVFCARVIPPLRVEAHFVKCEQVAVVLYILTYICVPFGKRKNWKGGKEEGKEKKKIYSRYGEATANTKWVQPFWQKSNTGK
ncbi:hypothetical protein POVWA2_038780 [Plasmodium ovale wallikeri]|uniref:Uncharacterized protein n=1 Tax=Plasmodium ovale wallikeri TaxID=864142 RepID=A0A1A8Z7N3_PLAOA|nr:hypothetical protein POVWA1_040000 [Plasmodium ovale wallikeri]SBT39951.1 hypothetical protein POVWA2_038780 [Plasmodium ovale wallikeri]